MKPSGMLSARTSGTLGENPALLAGLAVVGAYGKLLSLELGFLLVQSLSDLLVTE